MAKVLIVDDAVFIRKTVKQMLEKNGFEIAGEAGDGEEALNVYRATKPDVVTMDITMPNVDGIEGLKSILQYDPKAKVVMISAMGQESFVRNAIINGAKTFIVKPFDESGIIETIKKVVGIS